MMSSSYFDFKLICLKNHLSGNEPGFAISGSGSSLTQYGCDRDFFMFACATDQMSTIYTSAAAACVSKMCGGQLNVISGSASGATTYSESNNLIKSL